ncbi:bifunctional DNA-formamidopyrimidine glycosylase/DNA-(apurinic or apyrimidinic site) lyase [Corynebacterium glyciniphilum]|uniref:bifunctional DNA-formamidopyrimidine glycosylase/DNA-(apurinic or apyrimidinic site) lyase n=1 Tax=Corynebacterium glyciniphilum TaxID=1404244 RepID=UPI003FCF920E
MPELPEVEVVRRGLAEHILGAEFQRTDVLHPRAVRGQDGGAAAIAAGLSGARVADVRRRGKYLWLELAERGNLLVHLGMSGQMLLGEPGQVVSPHVRIRSRLVTALGETLELTFVDQRTFGRWELTGADPVPHIALDPMDPAFDPVETARSVRRRRSEIKRVLLDQTMVSGIGNIYADEALWAAGVHPRKRASAMRQQDVLRVLDAARQVMERALDAGGTSFDDLYVNVNGASGTSQADLNVYGRQGQPCKRCGTPIVRERFMNRSSHFCRSCQRKR